MLYEGYLLYPYRASATKNQLRWQFGVVMPRDYSEAAPASRGRCRPSVSSSPAIGRELDLRLRFLQMQARTVEAAVDGASDDFLPVDRLEVEGQELFAWDEGVEREIDQAAIDLGEICRAEKVFRLDFQRAKDIELDHSRIRSLKGRVVRERFPISGAIRVSGEALGSFIKLRVRVENWTPWQEWRMRPPARSATRAGRRACYFSRARRRVYFASRSARICARGGGVLRKSPHLAGFGWR